MSQSPAHRIRPLRWILLTLLTLGIVVAGLPATSASAATDGLVTGTVTYHQTSPDRTLQVYREGADGTWAADPTRTTTVAPDGHYSVHVPAGEPVKVRVSFGSPLYTYFYNDVFDDGVATTVQAAAGQSVPGIDLDVPVPIAFSGRLIDRSGHPVAGSVLPTVNTDGASVPIVDAPIPTDEHGEYTVFLPARAGGAYEAGVLGADPSGQVLAWLRGGTGSEPDWYINPRVGETYTGQDIELPMGSASTAPGTAAPPAHATRLRRLRSPVVHGVLRRSHRLHSTRGSYNKPPTSVRYQWLRNGRSIRGATHAAYRLRRADVRKHLSVRVTAYRAGAKVRATSARTAAVRPR